MIEVRVEEYRRKRGGTTKKWMDVIREGILSK